MAQALAVLVDGDNIAPRQAGPILSVAAGLGMIRLARVYTDATRPSDWHGATGYRLVHAGTGKNATDVLLALDALEMRLTFGIGRFVIASSDGDFAHLATRLREHGAHVTGLGEAKSPAAYRDCCSDFILLDRPAVCRTAPAASARISDLDQTLRSLIAAHSQKGQGMRMATLGQMMVRQHNLPTSALPETNWRAYFAARPELYDIDPRGPDAMVRFRPAGFMRVV